MATTRKVAAARQALETAALMLGTDKSRGCCLEMICADSNALHVSQTTTPIHSNVNTGNKIMRPSCWQQPGPAHANA